MEVHVVEPECKMSTSRERSRWDFFWARDVADELLTAMATALGHAVESAVR